MQGENLLVPPMPAGWVKAYGAQGNGINMVEYVPPGPERSIPGRR